MPSIYTTLLTLLLTFALHSANGQVDDYNIRQQVLQAGVVDSTFIFGKWTDSGSNEVHLTYLGEVTTIHGQTFKIVNSIWIWGNSKRATSRILVFNKENQYVGNYYISLTTDLPTKLDNGKLIFRNTAKDCDESVSTEINLNNGLPKQFFSECHRNSGDVYTFE